MKTFTSSKAMGRCFACALFCVAAGLCLFNASSRISRGSVTPLFPTYTTGNFTFSTPQALTHPPIPTIPGVLPDEDIEPEIKVDIYGTIYVSAFHLGGVDLWKSIDKGATFVYMGEPDGAQDKCGVPGTDPCVAGAGGFDESLDLSSGGYLYLASDSLANTTVSASYDGGTGGVEPGQKWEVNPASAGVPVDDRPWIAAYGPQTVYMTFNGVVGKDGVGDSFWFTKSTDAGKTFSAPSELMTHQHIGFSPAVDQYSGAIYTIYLAGGGNQLNLLRSTDGGATWADTVAYNGPIGTCVFNHWPNLAIDRGGNVHIVFTQSNGCGLLGQARTNAHVLLISTANPTAATPTWTTPLQIDNAGASTGCTTEPWIAAGSPGVVDVTWYGSSMSSPDSTPANPSEYWNVYFAQVTNALSGSPTVSSTQVVGSVHNLPICTQYCPGNTRDLYEYYTMTIDPEGNANIAYPDELNYCAAHPAPGCGAHTYYTKQISGPSAYAPPAAPAPATFAANLAMPNSTGAAEPNAEVDSYNCIYGGAIGNGSRDFLSTDAGASFAERPVVVGPGLHGQDFDIVTLPNADGTRPDQIYTADSGTTSVHIGKSTDRNMTFFQPGTMGAAGEVSVSTDRPWLAADRGVPTASDQTIYLMDHEDASEEIRFSALTNDTVWSPFTSGTTDPELILPPTSTLPNTNPGRPFVSKTTHNVFGVFGASTFTTNTVAPPFGKMPNLWAAVGAPPAAAGAPPGPFTNYPVFKGPIDSALTAPAGSATYGVHVGNFWPSGAADSEGNVYAVWAMNNARPNTVQGDGTPSSTFDIWMSVSHDGGVNFYGPFRVSSGVGTATFPSIAAGDAGRVDIVYYQSNSVAPPLISDPTSPGQFTGGTNAMPGDATWNVMFAQSLNANEREPVFTVSTASDHIIHTGSISNAGLTGTSDRTLLDFFSVAIGPDGLANIFCADNGTSGLHINYMRQNGGPLAKVNPSAVTCLPPPVLTRVVSEMTHGSAGTFDVDLPLNGNPGIECRSGGANGEYTLVFAFANPLTSVNGASVTTGSGTVTTSSIDSNDAHNYIVNLTGVTNAQYVTVTLNNVTDTAGKFSTAVSASMGVLLGDVNASGRVDAADVSLVRQQTLQQVTPDNFREDINASGRIDAADVSIARQQTLTSLP